MGLFGHSSETCLIGSSVPIRDIGPLEFESEFLIPDYENERDDYHVHCDGEYSDLSDDESQRVHDELEANLHRYCKDHNLCLIVVDESGFFELTLSAYWIRG